MLPVAVLGAAVLIYMAANNISFNLITGGSGNNSPFPDTFTEYASYSASFQVTPSEICRGDYVTVSITTNINNGVCAVFYKTSVTSWQFFNNVQLNGNGDFSQTFGPITLQPETYTARGVCCDTAGNCKMTNDVTLKVDTCGNPTPTPDNDDDGDEVYTCSSTLNGNCHLGTCPSGSTCKSNVVTMNCRCEADATPTPTPVYTCGSTYPTCGGTCQTGYICNRVISHCSCLPIMDHGEEPNTCGEQCQAEGYVTGGYCTGMPCPEPYFSEAGSAWCGGADPFCCCLQPV